MNEAVLVLPLGEAPREAVLGAVERQFVGARVRWFERQELRRRPLRAVVELMRPRVDAAVLVAPDLNRPRLRITSFMLALPRARTRWRIDLRGARERWSAREHLTRHAAAVARHLVACGLALCLGEAVLRGLDALLAGPAIRQQSNVRRPPRVLYLRSQLWLGLAGGGSVAHTAGVLGGLQQAGAEVRCVASDRLPGVEALTRVVTPEVWFDGWGRELEELAYNVAFGLAALGTARRFRPTLVYQRHTAFCVAGAVLSRALGVPLVLEFNSSEVWKGRYWGGLRLVRLARLVERINLRAADRVVVVSNVLRDDLTAAGVDRARIIVNANGVDPCAFHPAVDGRPVRRRVGIGDDEVVVGFSGTFGAWHGVPTLAQAIPLVLSARPNVRWLLLGDGPLRPTVDRVIEQRHLDERVVRVGMLPHADMPAHLAACDVLVSPHGRQADGGEFFGSPTKLYEYMAMGRPIVASAVGQIAEVLEDGVSARLVPPDDAQALSGAILQLVDDPGLRARLGRAARQAAEARHTWRQNAERVLRCAGHA